MHLVLKPHQIVMVNWLLSHDRCALWASMGSGKTVSVLFALSTIKILDPRPVLIIAPLRVAQSVWKDEVERWSAFSDMTVSSLIGSERQRIKALNTPAHLYIINFENISWLVKMKLDHWDFATIVVDESTKLKSFRTHQGTKQTRALGKVAFSKVKRFIELTRTILQRLLLMKAQS
ncbi:SNF2-related protein [Candidatus Liberibacter asiaticus]|uniref:SNF2-related protein n=1 Tax=Liberibacter asiaticus TaxID=34021 RepID=UPI00234A995A|nr:SNF2-related protein [Candidatus Liberibacter asiaticus]WCM58454.1 SNF2-related protein [Candidatus Liberibacter asiaticus]